MILAGMGEYRAANAIRSAQAVQSAMVTIFSSGHGDLSRTPP